MKNTIAICLLLLAVGLIGELLPQTLSQEEEHTKAVTRQANNTVNQETVSTMIPKSTETNRETNNIPIIGVSVSLGTSLLVVLMIAIVLACLLVKHRHQKSQRRQSSTVQDPSSGAGNIQSSSGAVTINNLDDEMYWKDHSSSGNDYLTSYHPYTSLIPSTLNPVTHYENLRRGRNRRSENSYETGTRSQANSYTYEHPDSPRLFPLTNANSVVQAYQPQTLPIAEGWEHLSIMSHEGSMEWNDAYFESKNVKAPRRKGRKGSLEYNAAYYELKNFKVPGPNRKTT